MTPLVAPRWWRAVWLGVPVWAWTVVAVVVGAVLRADIVADVSMWLDDGYTLRTVALPLGEVWGERVGRGHLPWFFLAFHQWVALAGYSLWVLRLPSLVAMLLVIPLAGWMGHRLGGAPGAVMALALAVVHGSLLRFSAELRMYSWLTLAGTAMVVAAWRHADRPTAGRAAVLGALHLVMLQLHVGAGLWTLAVLGAVGAAGWRGGWGRAWAVGWLAAVVVPITVSLPLYIQISSRVGGYDVEKLRVATPAAELAGQLYELAAGIGTRGRPWEMAAVIAAVLGAALWCRARAGRGDWPLVLLVAGWGAPAVAWLVGAVVGGMRGEARYYIMGTVPLVALMAGAVAALPWRLPPRTVMARAGMAVALLLAYVWTSEMVARTKSLLRGDGVGLNTMVGAIEATAEPGTVLVVTDSDVVPLLVDYYLSNEDVYPLVTVARDEPTSAVIAKLAATVAPTDDVVLVEYKTLTDDVERVLREQLGPWGSIEETDDKEPRALFFER